MEHRLAAEEAAERDAVEPAHELRRPPRPRRCARGRAGAARLYERRNSSVIQVAGRIGRRLAARAHDAGEVAVDREAPAGAAHAASRSCGADASVSRSKIARGIGRPPGDGGIGRPGEDARAVGGDEAVGIERAADGDQTVGPALERAAVGSRAARRADRVSGRPSSSAGGLRDSSTPPVYREPRPFACPATRAFRRAPRPRRVGLRTRRSPRTPRARRPARRSRRAGARRARRAPRPAPRARARRASRSRGRRPRAR